MSIVDYEKLDNCWLALHVRAGWELKSAADLRQKGFEEFVPMLREKRQWSDRVKMIETPLFAGYVFVRFNARNPLRIMSVPGAIRFVSNGYRPIPLESSEIESLQILRKAGITIKPCEFLEVGRQVRIGRGALNGLQGSIVRVKNEDRIVVSVSLLKRSVFVELDSDDVTLTPLPTTPAAASAPATAPKAPIRSDMPKRPATPARRDMPKAAGGARRRQHDMSKA